MQRMAMMQGAHGPAGAAGGPRPVATLSGYGRSGRGERQPYGFFGGVAFGRCFTGFAATFGRRISARINPVSSSNTKHS
jgi:hypothetical protein